MTTYDYYVSVYPSCFIMTGYGDPSKPRGVQVISFRHPETLDT